MNLRDLELNGLPCLNKVVLTCRYVASVNQALRVIHRLLKNRPSLMPLTRQTTTTTWATRDSRFLRVLRHCYSVGSRCDVHGLTTTLNAIATTQTCLPKNPSQRLLLETRPIHYHFTSRLVMVLSPVMVIKQKKHFFEPQGSVS